MKTAPAPGTGTDNTTAALTVTDVTVRFAGLTALDGVSFTVEPGSVHAVIGPNGAGKSTCFNVLSGVYRASAGTVHLGTTELTGLAPHTIAGLGVARTFQNLALPRMRPSPTACCSAATGSPAPGSSPPVCGCRPPPARRSAIWTGSGRSPNSSDWRRRWSARRDRFPTGSRSSSSSAAPSAWSRGSCSSTSRSRE
ncbi:hypothetical protein Smic_69680 [Streptomyces microflavus]|uniref:ABC transporter domain-containing protein n=1 Tax=Streptomyces microflavus TaxID=1919 RepID=A0A7J0D122_STRMI|nr:hypothetical protein Smic_69680 [Streptomyces microflavus]